MTEQDLINRGSDAEQFKRYTDENPYFNSVIALAKTLIAQNIGNLKPDETMKFTILSSQRIAIDELLNLIEIDIYQGQKAIERMQIGERDKKTYEKGSIL